MKGRRRWGNKISQKLLSFVGSKREVEREKFYGYSDEKKKHFGWDCYMYLLP